MSTFPHVSGSDESNIIRAMQALARHDYEEFYRLLPDVIRLGLRSFFAGRLGV
jgi:hypothetical protein